MHEKKLALPYLARAEQQALKVGIFITKKLQIFDYHFDQNSLNHVPERNLGWGNHYLEVKDENLGLTKILTKFWSNFGQIWPFGHRPKV